MKKRFSSLFYIGEKVKKAQRGGRDGKKNKGIVQQNRQ